MPVIFLFNICFSNQTMPREKAFLRQVYLMWVDLPVLFSRIVS
jgi:hypothetical protein